VLLGKWVVGMGAIGKWGKVVKRRWHAMMTRTTARTDTWWHRWWPAKMAKACSRVWQAIWEEMERDLLQQPELHMGS